MRGEARIPLQELPTSALGYHFRDRTLLEAALTHPSSTDATQVMLRLHHQRLEFLGDAVWGFSISDVLIALWPMASEGELTLRRARLVSASALAEIAERHGITSLIRLSKGEESAGGRQRPSILSSVFEAIIGAIYLDGGRDEIQRLASQACSEWIADKTPSPDSKTLLQHLLQARFRSAPRYCLIRRTGPSHAPTFEIEVRIGRSAIGRGIGRSRQEAEHEAARQALTLLPTSLSTTSSSPTASNY